MRRSVDSKRDPLEVSMERALAPGEYIGWRVLSSFVTVLEDIADEIEQVEPARGAQLFEMFIAACHEKIEQIDDDGQLAPLVEELFARWVKARQKAAADPDETVRFLGSHIKADPYGFASRLEDNVVGVMDGKTVAVFETYARAELEAKLKADNESAYKRRRWADVLRAIYTRRKNLDAYLKLCEATETTPKDCVRIASILRARSKPKEALEWIERGLALCKKDRAASEELDLTKVKRELLTKLGRKGDALDDAWKAFESAPSIYAYKDLMKLVPRSKRSAWHVKAMKAAEKAHGQLFSLIELWLETKELERLVERLRAASVKDLQDVGYYSLEKANDVIEKGHPDVAAKVYRALALRILDEKRSRAYHHALRYLGEARECYGRAKMPAEWTRLVALIRREHHLKRGFVAQFEDVVAGGPAEQPSFLERAREKWGVR